MTKHIKLTLFFVLVIFIYGCDDGKSLVFIYSNDENNNIAYFEPAEIGTRINIYSSNSKNVIGYFDRNEIGKKNFVIRKDGGELLYFTEAKDRGNIVYLFDPMNTIWGYFHQF